MAEVFCWILLLLIYMLPGYVCIYGWRSMFDEILSRKRRVAARICMLLVWPIWSVGLAVLFITAGVIFFVEELLK